MGAFPAGWGENGQRMHVISRAIWGAGARTIKCRMNACAQLGLSEAHVSPESRQTLENVERTGFRVHVTLSFLELSTAFGRGHAFVIAYL